MVARKGRQINQQRTSIPARRPLATNHFSRHTSGMLEEPTASHLEKAHLILAEFGPLIGPAGAMSDVIARAVAAGIVLGRKEGMGEARRRAKALKSQSRRF
jgi:hypothetical protein